MSDQTQKPKRSNSYALACHANWAYDADQMDAYVATLTARSEALETELEHQKTETTRAVLHYTVKGYTAGENADSKHWRARAETAEARCEALTAERDELRKWASDTADKLDYVARCQHLEQAVRKVRAHTGYLPSADYLLLAGLLASIERIADAALASLLPTQEEPQTDENRVSFAAGYSQALDDQAKGLK